MTFEPFPRPYRTLLVSGWTIRHGQVEKVGFARVSKNDDPEGTILVTECLFADTIFPAFINNNEQIGMTLVCVCVLSRPDVQAMINSQLEEVGE